MGAEIVTETREKTPTAVSLPKPTAWPIVLAFGVSLLFAGMVTSAPVSILGAVLLISGCVGWFCDMFPHEQHEVVPVVDSVISITTTRPEVAQVQLITHEVNRSRLPLEIYPVSAGVKGGLAGCLAMAILAEIYGIASKHGIWYPINAPLRTPGFCHDSNPPYKYIRWRPVQRLGSIFTHPAFCWLSATIMVIVWHLPGVFEFALRSESWHEVEHACLFTTSILFWWPVVQPWPSIARWPRWSIPLYLFLGVLANDALSAVLALWDRVLYPSYATTENRLFNISPLDDQAFAGALMWVFGTFVYLAPAVVTTMHLLSQPESSSRMPVVGTLSKAI